MQSNTSWARVALWGVLGFPALIGQADVAMAQQRLVTTGNTSSLAACVATVQQQAAAGDAAARQYVCHSQPWFS